jgi:putative ABC transport system ATP-binding protein
VPTVEIRDLVVEYNGGGYAVRPLDGLTASIGDGDLALLVGPSGSGKTTLLSCLGGILRPTAGQIIVDGTDLAAADDKALLAHRRGSVGFVFQAFNLVHSLSALDNVAMPLRLTGTRAGRARERARLLLERVGLADRLDHRPGQLSGGQQQRVGIARGLATGAPLLLADEPTANLDYVQAEGIILLLREIASAGRTVIVSTHDDRLLPIADRAVDLVPVLAENTEARSLALEPGDVLFRQQSSGSRVYFIESGRLAIVREFADGTEEVLAERAAGEYVGELGPMLGQPRSATTRAIETTTVTSLTLQEFRQSRRPTPAPD